MLQYMSCQTKLYNLNTKYAKDEPMFADLQAEDQWYNNRSLKLIGVEAPST